ncbi:MAG: DNA alkylation repair protein, partial [Syntrophaceae bacterium]|nr:DNA alkylation repair protein [Syntrophaceae bacterium]
MEPAEFPLAKGRVYSVTSKILNEIQALRNEEKARIFHGFFKTGPGQYGEGDEFWGIPVPVLRKLAAKYRDLPLETALALLRHPVHETRFFALLLLIRTFHEGNLSVKKTVYDAYLSHTRFINNWDLVDLSAPPIVGAHLADKERHVLTSLAASDLLWERRIAIVATSHFIRNGEFRDTLEI